MHVTPQGQTQSMPPVGRLPHNSVHFNHWSLASRMAQLAVVCTLYAEGWVSSEAPSKARSDQEHRAGCAVQATPRFQEAQAHWATQPLGPQLL